MTSHPYISLQKELYSSVLLVYSYTKKKYTISLIFMFFTDYTCYHYFNVDMYKSM